MSLAKYRKDYIDNANHFGLNLNDLDKEFTLIRNEKRINGIVIGLDLNSTVVPVVFRNKDNGTIGRTTISTLRAVLNKPLSINCI